MIFLKKIKEHPILLISSLFFLLMGIFLILSDPGYVINLIYWLVGLPCIFSGIFKLIFYQDNEDFFEGLVSIIIGICFIFLHNFIVTIILGLVFIGFPIYRIIKSNHKKEMFLQELPFLIIGLVMMLSGDLIIHIFIKVLGVIAILYAIYLFVSIFKNYRVFYFSTKRIKREPIRRKSKRDDDYIDAKYEEREVDE